MIFRIKNESIAVKWKFFNAKNAKMVYFAFLFAFFALKIPEYSQILMTLLLHTQFMAGYGICSQKSTWVHQGRIDIVAIRTLVAFFVAKSRRAEPIFWKTSIVEDNFTENG